MKEKVQKIRDNAYDIIIYCDYYFVQNVYKRICEVASLFNENKDANDAIIKNKTKRKVNDDVFL